MKSMLKSLKILIPALLCLMLLSACGQKGPLMLPEKKADIAKPATAEAKANPATQH
ncbi:MAG: lipoprotein [Burkholderiales bacterium]|nr:lipoprotein [Burkholderiales bacterium]MBI3711961.1 lipoprotein [Burkholderiales bacterium]